MGTSSVRTRGQGSRLGRNPSPAEILAARQSAGLTQTAAGALVHASLRAWQAYEAGDRRMHPAIWELFRIKIGLPPESTAMA